MEAVGSQIFNVLKAVAQVAKEGMIEVFQHPPLPDDVPYTLRAYHCASCKRCPYANDGYMPTFIFANVLQGEGQASVLSLDDANLSKCAFSHHSQESEMIEVDCYEREDVSNRAILETGSACREEDDI